MRSSWPVVAWICWALCACAGPQPRVGWEELFREATSSVDLDSVGSATVYDAIDKKGLRQMWAETLRGSLPQGDGNQRGRWSRAALAATAFLVAAAGHGALVQQDQSADSAALDASRPITYYIAPGERGSKYRESDRGLAEWALEAWARVSGGILRFEPAPEAMALVRIYFVEANSGYYGETRPLLIDGRRGAAVFIRPDIEALGPDLAADAGRDSLFRETIVYLTCVHELGHALGLAHTADFRDIMYFFGFGGDIPRLFRRFRDQLGSRDDIPSVSPLSSGDLDQLRGLYGPRSSD